MLDQLRDESEVISLEAIAGAAQAQQALTRLPQFLNNAKTFFGKAFVEPLHTLLVKKDLNWFAQKIQPVPYVDLRKNEITVPVGLNTDLLTYGVKLLDAADYTSTFRVEVLDPFNRWLAGKIADPSALANLRPATELESIDKRDVAKMTAKVLGCFDEKQNTASMEYGKAIKRNADWTEISKLALRLQDIALSEDHRLVAQQVSKASDYLDTLIARIGSQGDAYQLSGQTTAAFAKLAYTVAREIEFYGIIRFRIEEYQHALKESIKQMEGVLKTRGI